MVIKGNQWAPVVQAVPEGTEGGVTTDPVWMLMPWVVFAVAAGIKFWLLTSAWRQRGAGTAPNTDQFRRSLERIWQKDQKAV